ncbi:precorrin-6A synthase (deacetylating) [Roseibium aggregatum]|uniref:Precorrin-6A synthase [deacetylating] n=1 Tax=Roseibium aggregatum TaxID=187304 RepID=A0A939EEY7_9HYPH|nr:precorrin-6A synthase (deacetylating) [Roseibium aggregatum]MBN9671915.1 precorrin-6A synthase (deacetylating) [Roseibium aggregatum]
MKRSLMVIGIGAGNPDYVTVQAIKAMNRVSVFFIPNKGTKKTELLRLRRDICERFIENSDYRLVEFDIPERSKYGRYKQNVELWREEVRRIYEKLLTESLAEDEIGAFLVWGDPSLYDGTLSILDTIGSSGTFDLDFEVIPGISSVQALAANHKVPLNRIGESLTIMTARQLSEAFPIDQGNVVVMLDGQGAFRSLDGDINIHWGAYIGTEDEILVSGKVRDVRDDIERIRNSARNEHGWVMDTYLLSKDPKTGGE